MPLRAIIPAVLGVLLMNACSRDRGAADPAAAVSDPLAANASYVGAGACSGCHEAAYRAWQGSHHDLAMDEATAETVLGDFNDATFTYYGIASRFFRRDGKFFVRTDGANGTLQDFAVAFVFGVYPLQQYLVAFPGGRYQVLTWRGTRGRARRTAGAGSTSSRISRSRRRRAALDWSAATGITCAPSVTSRESPAATTSRPIPTARRGRSWACSAKRVTDRARHTSPGRDVSRTIRRTRARRIRRGPPASRSIWARRMAAGCGTAAPRSRIAPGGRPGMRRPRRAPPATRAVRPW